MSWAYEKVVLAETDNVLRFSPGKLFFVLTFNKFVLQGPSCWMLKQKIFPVGCTHIYSLSYVCLTTLAAKKCDLKSQDFPKFSSLEFAIKETPSLTNHLYFVKPKGFTTLVYCDSTLTIPYIPSTLTFSSCTSIFISGDFVTLSSVSPLTRLQCQLSCPKALRSTKPCFSIA